MKILLTGATGFIGSHLAKRLTAAGHSVMPVSRREGALYNWSTESLTRGVREADAVIHLAGENLSDKRWSDKQKEILRSSRLDATRKLAELVAARKPSCFISASAIGYYGASETAVFSEEAPHGAGFLAELCADWEAATGSATKAGVRTAIVRTGVVMGKGGGALSRMLPFFKLGLGGPLGNGKQWVSWIHIDDVTALYQFLTENPSAIGAYNGVAPSPVTMKALSRSLGKALSRPAIFPVPAPVLRLAFGELADVLLTGQIVKPRRTLEAGFTFRFADIDSALRDIVSK